MLRLFLWLARPQTRRKLLGTLQVVSVAVVVWTTAIAFGMTKERSTVAARQADLSRLHTKNDSLLAQIGIERRAADRHPKAVIADQISDPTTVADVINRLAASAGARLDSMHFDDVSSSGHHSHHRRSQSQNDSQAGGGSSGSGDVDGDDDVKNGFGLEMTGDFDSILKFLDSMADSPIAADLTDVHIQHTSVDPATGKTGLTMNILGKLDP